MGLPNLACNLWSLPDGGHPDNEGKEVCINRSKLRRRLLLMTYLAQGLLRAAEFYSIATAAHKDLEKTSEGFEVHVWKKLRTSSMART